MTADSADHEASSVSSWIRQESVAGLCSSLRPAVSMASLSGQVWGAIRLCGLPDMNQRQEIHNPLTRCWPDVYPMAHWNHLTSQSTMESTAESILTKVTDSPVSPGALLGQPDCACGCRGLQREALENCTEARSLLLRPGLQLEFPSAQIHL